MQRVYETLLLFIPSADGWSMCRDGTWGKITPSNSALPGSCKPQQPAVTNWLVTLKQKVFCSPSGQPSVLCIILKDVQQEKLSQLKLQISLDVNWQTALRLIRGRSWREAELFHLTTALSPDKDFCQAHRTMWFSWYLTSAG